MQLRDDFTRGMNFVYSLLLEKVEDIALLESEGREPENYRRKAPQRSLTLAFEDQLQYCPSMSDTRAKFMRQFADSPLLYLLRRIRRTRDVTIKGTFFSDERLNELLDDPVHNSSLRIEDLKISGDGVAKDSSGNEREQ